MAPMTFDRRQAIAASTAGICSLAGGARGAWAQAAASRVERSGRLPVFQWGYAMTRDTRRDAALALT
jgi:hypothetical protein